MNIKTWQEEAKEWPDHRRGLATNQMIWMQQEIDELRAAYEALQKELTHWKANHADLKERLHVATHRTDIPNDRLPLFDEMKADIAALQKENAELKRNHKFTCENLANTVPFIEELEQKNAAQAKRIEELLKTNNEQDLLIKSLMSTAGLLGSEAQVTEIESLRKHVADLEETNGLLQTQVHCLEMVATSKNGE